MSIHPIAGASIPIPESVSTADDMVALVALVASSITDDREEASTVSPNLDAILRSDWGEIIFERAARAYFRRFGANAGQPSASGSEFEGPTIFVLNNARSELARYRIKFTGTGRDVAVRLRFVESNDPKFRRSTGERSIGGADSADSAAPGTLVQIEPVSSRPTRRVRIVR